MSGGLGGCRERGMSVRDTQPSGTLMRSTHSVDFALPGVKNSSGSRVAGYAHVAPRGRVLARRPVPSVHTRAALSRGVAPRRSPPCTRRRRRCQSEVTLDQNRHRRRRVIAMATARLTRPPVCARVRLARRAHTRRLRFRRLGPPPPLKVTPIRPGSAPSATFAISNSARGKRRPNVVNADPAASRDRFASHRQRVPHRSFTVCAFAARHASLPKHPSLASVNDANYKALIFFAL
ncbi:unnamed protein product [Lampetra planeri]